MKKIVINLDEKTSEIVDMTAEEETQRQTDATNAETQKQAEETARQAQADLKASAKAKLVAGTPLSEEEANTIVL